jgi:thioredoxin reductase (NADPH)
MNKNYDVVIIGAGPAGLAAGLYAARGDLKTAIFEKALVGGQIVLTTEVENYPGIPEKISGFDIIDRMKKQAETFGVEIIEESVNALGLRGICKLIETPSGIYEARTVIIATGAHPRKLNIPGELKLTGRGVSYCATCDGALYRGKKVAVIGGGDSAVEEALFLTRFAEKVYIVHRRDQLRAQKIIQDRAFKNPKIEFIWNSVPQEILGNDAVEGVLLYNKVTKERQELAVDGVFVYVGIIPNTELLEGKINLDNRGFILTDETMHTNIPGVYAAGDVVHKVLRQVVTAAADGAIAAYSAQKWIEENLEELKKS